MCKPSVQEFYLGNMCWELVSDIKMLLIKVLLGITWNPLLNVVIIKYTRYLGADVYSQSKLYSFKR